MLDKSNNLNCSFLVVISDLYSFQQIVLLNLCFVFSKNSISSFIEEVTTGTQSLTLIIWNVAPAVNIAALGWIGGLASGSSTILGVIDISDTKHYFDHEKLSSISQLIKYCDGLTTFVFNILLLFAVLPINFVLYSKNLLLIVLLLFILLFSVLFSFASSFTLYL